VKSEAIRHAIKLHNEPALLSRFSDPFRQLPDGITELLRIVSSDGALKRISNKNNLNALRFRRILLNYIETVLFQECNSDLRKLGLDQGADSALQKLHYKLLMNIFHPDKLSNDLSSPHYAQIISKAYKRIRATNPSVTINKINASHFSTSSIERYTTENNFFRLNSREIFFNPTLLISTISLFLVIISLMIFLLLPPSPQIIVKKPIGNEAFQNLTDRSIDLSDERRKSTLLEIRAQQQLSKN
jgi:DnaJ-domain-containing protein 1